MMRRTGWVEIWEPKKIQIQDMWQPHGIYVLLHIRGYIPRDTRFMTDHPFPDGKKDCTYAEANDAVQPSSALSFWLSFCHAVYVVCRARGMHVDLVVWLRGPGCEKAEMGRRE